MKILLADDHDLVRETIAAFLASEGFEAVYGTGSLDEAVTAYRSWGPFDLVLLDLNMPGMGGLDGLRRMFAVAGDTPVAIISGVAQPDKVQAAIEAGARGFLPKTMSAKSISAAIRFMAAGEIYMPYALMQQGAATDGFDLKPRERDVLRGLSEGLSNKEIAIKLALQEVTVKLHVKTLSRKLNARNRTHAAMIARDNGLI
ncbi:response regulator transcription factor [Roseibacterium sp. SDUM158016]|nr:response regulator transcription factor [Roseibacterium sp. SDUM158016]